VLVNVLLESVRKLVSFLHVRRHLLAQDVLRDTSCLLNVEGLRLAPVDPTERLIYFKLDPMRILFALLDGVAQHICLHIVV